MKYNFEYEDKLKACFIGAGEHSFRNIYPTFQYAPVDLVAVCDLNKDKASAYALQFGANKSYSDYHEMLEIECPDVVFIVAAYYPDGRVQATDIAIDVVNAGAHVWMEKPTAASVEEINQMIASSEASGRYIMTGLKKIFTPAMEKVKSIIETPAFGKPSSMYIRYPEVLPPFEKRQNLRNVTGFLDHIYHPAAVINYLMGNIDHIFFSREPNNGGSVTNIQFTSGSIGTMHLTGGMSTNSPLERVEVIGEGANIIVENGVKVTYYRKASRSDYGRTPSFIKSDMEEAPIIWEPEFSLGQLYNKNIFYLGYVNEVQHFCDSILTGRPPEKGTLRDSLEIAKLFEAYCHNPEGSLVSINSQKVKGGK